MYNFLKNYCATLQIDPIISFYFSIVVNPLICIRLKNLYFFEINFYFYLVEILKKKLKYAVYRMPFTKLIEAIFFFSDQIIVFLEYFKKNFAYCLIQVCNRINGILVIFQVRRIVNLVGKILFEKPNLFGFFRPYGHYYILSLKNVVVAKLNKVINFIKNERVSVQLLILDIKDAFIHYVPLICSHFFVIGSFLGTSLITLLFLSALESNYELIFSFLYDLYKNCVEFFFNKNFINISREFSETFNENDLANCYELQNTEQNLEEPKKIGIIIFFFANCVFLYFANS